MNPLFTKIDSLKNTLHRLRPLSNAELQRLREEFIIETTYNSNAIEGNTLTLRETALILQEGITFYYIIEAASQNTPLTEDTIKAIHSLVLMNDRENRGKYRSVPVRILGALHTPLQPYQIEPAINQLLQQYALWKEEKHILEAIALLHLEFESIHPFIDGNGRTGRLLLNLELIKAGLLPVDIKFTDRRKYYDCFDAYHSGHNNPEQMTSLIATYEQEELERYIAIVSP